PATLELLEKQTSIVRLKTLIPLDDPALAPNWAAFNKVAGSMTAISHDQSKGIIQDTADVRNFALSVCLAVEHNLLPRDMFKHLTTLSLSVTP
ncbi:hypothetical protein K443DRAFT_65286, partial [Laccaria amethystina LaAM-08-1]